MIRLNERQRKRRQDRIATELALIAPESNARIRAALFSTVGALAEHGLTYEEQITVGESLAACSRWVLAGSPRTKRRVLTPGRIRQLRGAVATRRGSPEAVS